MNISISNSTKTPEIMYMVMLLRLTLIENYVMMEAQLFFLFQKIIVRINAK